jgi:hypothetical protein
VSWLLLIWTALIVIWVNAERFAPAAKLWHLCKRAAAPVARAAQHEGKRPPPE